MNTAQLATVFDQAVENGVEAISDTFANQFNQISDLIELVLHGIEQVFLFPPFYIVIAVFCLLAWKTNGKSMTLFTLAGFALCYAMGLWEETMLTMALVIASVMLTLIVAIPLGVAAGSNRKVSEITRVLMDFLQTMPPYVYLIPAIAILGFGASPAIAATCIIAFAPAVPLTSLGIRGVPEEHVEVGLAFGATPAQSLFKIKLPSALSSIMVGVNQSLMLALSMAVIAGIIGAGGLGKEVYRAIRVLDVGKAFDAGICIVILAIILDRISAGAVAMFQTEGIIMEFPLISIGQYLAKVVDWLNVNYSLPFEILSSAMEGSVKALEAVLLWPNAFIVMAVFSLGAWKIAGYRVGAITLFGLLYCFALNLWKATMLTTALVAVSSLAALLLAIPLGIWSATNKTVDNITRPIMDLMQTMPPWVYLIPAVILFSLGRAPAVIATAVFAIPPALRLTKLGIQGVPEEHLEVGKAFGATPQQVIWKIQIPSALPSIMAGVNQCIMMSLAMVVLAGLIGAGGLGGEVVRGLTRMMVGGGVRSGLAIVILAIIFDRVTQGMVARFQDPGVKTDLTAQPDAELMKTRILVTYDTNVSSERVLENAVDRAAIYNAFVYLIRSCPRDTGDREITELRKKLNEICRERFESKGIESESHILVRGLEPGEDIVKFALDKQVNEIIIGIKKRSKVGKAITGSTAQYVILESHCPVLTVR